MAETKMNGNLWKVMLWIAGVLITVGVYTAIVHSNTERICRVEEKTSTHEGDIREMKTDIRYIKEGVDEIKKELRRESYRTHNTPQ